ncbi:membrane progestin receptor delta isoform X2 [Ochotona princeps]|uniref:membrane progestin receptor delta isoform X2 n=1 Tax=Ochotona princeps TaxID=9978 RepID=UPI00271544B5|nr:membrane progestin receptor delta isoform X2 [Ochotona princeps]
MLLELHPGLGLYSLGTSLSMLGLGQAMCRRLSELPANGAGPPCAAPWRLNNAGIVLAPFVSPLPPRPGPPPCSATFPMPAWLMGAWDSTRGALGLELADPPAWEHPAYSGSSWRCQSSMLSLKLPQLLQVHQVPRVFWEDGIMSGYRCPTSSALDCVLSSFQLTNETVNIWTHFLPTWYFLWRLLALVGGPSFRTEPYHWPLLIFLLPACLYPFASCCAHTFSSMSARARHICYFLDYGALSLYSLGSAFPYAAYSMPASWLHSRLHQLFVPTAALNSFLCTGLSCYSRFPELESPRLSKVLRTAAFAYPFLFDNLPLFYRLGLCWSRVPTCGQEALSPSHAYHLLCALLTGFLFTSHLPERLAPGRFDYIGHSHQLFHVCAVLGTHFQLEAVLADMGSRRAWLAWQEAPQGLAGLVATLGLAVAGNLLIITAFTAWVLRAPATCPLVQGSPPLPPLGRASQAKRQ